MSFCYRPPIGPKYGDRYCSRTYGLMWQTNGKLTDSNCNLKAAAVLLSQRSLVTATIYHWIRWRQIIYWRKIPEFGNFATHLRVKSRTISHNNSKAAKRRKYPFFALSKMFVDSFWPTGRQKGHLSVYSTNLVKIGRQRIKMQTLTVAHRFP